MIDQIVVDRLLQKGQLTPDALAKAEEMRAEQGGSLTRLLVSTDAITENQLLSVMAEQLGIPTEEEIDHEEIETELIESLPINFAKHHKVLPLWRRGESVIVAIADPLDTTALDDVRGVIGEPVSPLVVPGDTIVALINRVYDRKAADNDLAGEDTDEGDDLTDLIDVDDDAPIIRWVNSLF